MRLFFGYNCINISTMQQNCLQPTRGLLRRRFSDICSRNPCFSHSWAEEQRNICSAFALGICLLVLTDPCQLRAQEPNQQQRDEDISATHKDIETFIERLRPPLFDGLTGADARIYKEINFRVVDKDDPSRAGSLREDGSRIIEIDIGYGRKIEMMAEALIIEQAQNRPVLVPYIKYVALNRGAPFVKDPTAFARFDPDKIDKDPQLSKALIAMTLSGLAFVIAHEVGHHVLGHYDKPLPKDLDKRRQMEIDADSWALKTCVQAKPHFSTLGGVLPLLFDYYSTSDPLVQETHADHPASLRRIESMFEAMDDALPQFREDIQQQGVSYTDFQKFIKESLNSYRHELQNYAPTVQELRPMDKGSNLDEGARQADQQIGHDVESQKVPLFTDVEDYRRALAVVPKTDSIDSDLSLFEAHANRGLGAEFNTPMSLTAIFCPRKTAFFALETAISNALKGQSYDIFTGWDKFGFLTAEKSSRATIFKTPALYEDIKLHIKIDQTDFDERAITIDYEIRAGVRTNDQGSWTDQSSSQPAKRYIDDLRGQLREAAEGALKNNCKKVAVHDIKSKEAGIGALARESGLTPSQVQALQTALGKQNE